MQCCIDSHEDSYDGIGRKPIRSWSNARFTSDELIASSLAGLRESDDDDFYRSSKRRRVRFEANDSQDPSVYVSRCRAEQEGYAISQYLQQTMHQVAKLNLELSSLAPMIYSNGFLSCDERIHGSFSSQSTVQDTDQEILAETQRINTTLDTLLHRMLVPLTTASPQSFPSRSHSSTASQPAMEQLHQVRAQLMTLEAHLRGSVGFDRFVARMRPILESLWSTCRSNLEEAHRQKQKIWKAKAEEIYKRLKSSLLDSEGNSSLTKQLLDTMEDTDKLVFSLERSATVDDKAVKEQPLINAIAALRSAFYEMEAHRWSCQAAVDMESTQSQVTSGDDIDRSASASGKLKTCQHQPTKLNILCLSNMIATNLQQSVQTPVSISTGKITKQVAKGSGQGKIQRRTRETPIPNSMKRKNSSQVVAAAPTKLASARSVQPDIRPKPIRPVKMTGASGSSLNSTETPTSTKSARKSTLSMGALAARDTARGADVPHAKSNYATRGRSAVATQVNPQVDSLLGGQSANGSAGAESENRSALNGPDKDVRSDRDSPVRVSSGTIPTADGDTAQRSEYSVDTIGKERQHQDVASLGRQHASSSGLVFSVASRNRDIRPRAEVLLRRHEKPRVTKAESIASLRGEKTGSAANRISPDYSSATNLNSSQADLTRNGVSVSTTSAASLLLPVGWADVATSSDEDSEPKENEASATNTKANSSESSRRRGRFAGCAVCLKNNSYHALLLCDNECGRGKSSLRVSCRSYPLYSSNCH